jgi:hypothetical protein
MIGKTVRPDVYPPSAAPVRKTPDSFGEATRVSKGANGTFSEVINTLLKETHGKFISSEIHAMTVIYHIILKLQANFGRSSL